jgi:hypothetical protein
MAKQNYKLSVSVKIGITFGILILFFVVASLSSLRKMKEMSRNVQFMDKVLDKSESAVDALNALVIEADKNVARFVAKPTNGTDMQQFIKQIAAIDSISASLGLLTSECDSLKSEYAEVVPAIEKVKKQYSGLKNLMVSSNLKHDTSAQIDLNALVSNNSMLHQQSIVLATRLDLFKTEMNNVHAFYLNQVQCSIAQLQSRFSFFIILFIILCVLLGFLITFSIVKPIRYINRELHEMGKGVLPKQPLDEGLDEIGNIAVNVNALVDGLQKISLFANEMGKGNFDSYFEPLSDKDTLGNALVRMREELKQASEEESKRKKEDQQRNWASQGIARFSEILRENNNNLEELGFNVVSSLVKYLGANQGGLFIFNENEGIATIDMAACYAYDRKKFLKKSFKPGEGLVGRCVQEQESIFLTDIPTGYAEITSGLGGDDPSCLLIVPLKANEMVHGVIEIASFEILEIYQIDFIEKIAESIASTIATVKINIQTKQLLEQSRRQAEDMASQEQEMRQNMEELRATQELSARREAELLQQIEELKKRL